MSNTVDTTNRQSLVASRARARRRLRQLRAQEHKAKVLIARRNAQLKALPKTSPQRRACNFALAQVGTHEDPAFSNRGPKISDWEKNSIGGTGFAWCQCFVNACMVAGGRPQLHSAFTPAVVQMARNKENGLRLVSLANIAPGDLVYYKWPGVSRDFCDHVGFYIGGGRVVEGNTSPGTSGSQNNGGGVYLRSIHEGARAPFIVAVVRPTYK